MTVQISLPVFASSATKNDFAVVVVELVDAPVVDDRRRRRAEVQVDRLRRPGPRPEQRAVEAVAEHADVAAERRIEPLAVGGRRLGRVGVLAMAAAGRRPAVRLALPHDLARLRVERRDDVADRARLARQLDVARDQLLDDLVLGQPLLLELGGVVVAEDALARRLEGVGVHGGGHEHAIAPDDRRRPAAAGQIGGPGDVLGRRPRDGQRRVVGDAGAVGAAELRPRGRTRGTYRGNEDDAGEDQAGQDAHGRILPSMEPAPEAPSSHGRVVPAHRLTFAARVRSNRHEPAAGPALRAATPRQGSMVQRRGDHRPGPGHRRQRHGVHAGQRRPDPRPALPRGRPALRPRRQAPDVHRRRRADLAARPARLARQHDLVRRPGRLRCADR